MQKTNNTTTLLHLSLMPNIGPASVLKLIRGFYKDFFETHAHPHLSKPTFDLQQLYHYKTTDFINKFGVSSRIATILVNGLSNKKELDQELHLIEKYNITTLNFLDDTYPNSLKEIHHPPLIIYSKGVSISNDHNKNTKRIAIVGSRKADRYAKSCIETLVPMLVFHGWEIVSGGAAGVDSMAHHETVTAGGKTIAVFGSGLMEPYPASNKELFRSIVKNNGTLVSPFSLRTTPNKGNFPARNRIISGLSQGCIVIQAAEKSGALITAHFALNQGRQVFALPGKVTNQLSAGCHKLIQQGAKLITNVEDILEEFEITNSTQPPAKTTTIHEKTVPIKITVKKEENVNKHPLLKHITAPCAIDELSVKTNMSLLELQDQLFQLQLEGIIKQNYAGLWERVHVNTKGKL
ncbi:DNA-processing protein DprA [Candidatus Dependentiae bacterium]|nr:DNA-processing protein DprA [Candidatus Dependentiae bacterium]